jgi:hypothetical protein
VRGRGTVIENISLELRGRRGIVAENTPLELRGTTRVVEPRKNNSEECDAQR